MKHPPSMLQLQLRQLGSQFCILGAQAINLGLQFFILGTQPSYYFTHSASSPGRDKMQKFLVVFNAAAHRLGEVGPAGGELGGLTVGAAGTSLVSPTWKARWGASGLSCSRRSRGEQCAIEK
jgi:hypothetical protein